MDTLVGKHIRFITEPKRMGCIGDTGIIESQSNGFYMIEHDDSHGFLAFRTGPYTETDFVIEEE